LLSSEPAFFQCAERRKKQYGQSHSKQNQVGSRVDQGDLWQPLGCGYGEGIVWYGSAGFIVDTDLIATDRSKRYQSDGM
jgi:hypothetical protein